MTIDTSALTIVINMTGWVVVGYLAKTYMEDIKFVKIRSNEIDVKYQQIMLEQRLQAQKIEFLEKAIEDIDNSVHEIKDMLAKNNEYLIHELKEQLKGRH
jgi:hypothetical protein